MTLEPEIGPDFGGLSEWPLEHVVKVLCFYHPDDDEATKAKQEDVVTRLFHACRRNRLEMLLEIIPSKVGPVEDDTSAKVIQRFYDLGVYPDWWKLEPTSDPEAWAASEAAILRHDPRCRGIVLLGLSAPQDELLAGIAAAAPFPLVKGFAVGRTIFHDVASRWLRQEIDDEGAIEALTANLRVLADGWRAARDVRRVSGAAA